MTTRIDDTPARQFTASEAAAAAEALNAGELDDWTYQVQNVTAPTTGAFLYALVAAYDETGAFVAHFADWDQI
jgi:hypothetical protein